ncbi:uroporphyrinogen-III C-methyltransferase [Granulicoccus sp. GXG6511]|uniref:uroporphyrinogen-III C-methyltransferase n=1 Tax=Granulicoccus sp. GXG6511 TaxID=3381351 RepID=UPI003D7D711F
MFSLAVDLTDVPVLAVGGGPVSARRVHAFLAAGAAVTVVAPTLCPALQPLPLGVRWHARGVAPEDLDGVRLVHTATGDPEIDRKVVEMAGERGIWCVNASASAEGTAVVPARASVPTPTGEVTVAVSSADPVRSVEIRNRISHDLRTEPTGLRPRRPHGGWVALVGGGPGDAELLTSRALTLLHSADVVVIDRLAPHSVLQTLDPDVLVIDVGKVPGRHAVPQHEINRLIVEHAHAGRGVVRLKGGDPYVLGRGEEERLACVAAGVEVEVVPGISSALAVPAAAGIPVTHRGISRGFTVVTGHDQIPQLPADTGHTLVILMGVAQLRDTATRLIALGRSADCPVAVVERGCTPQQRVTVAPLARIAGVAAARGVESPAVIVVGDVVRLGPDWAAGLAQCDELDHDRHDELDVLGIDLKASA